MKPGAVGPAHRIGHRAGLDAGADRPQLSKLFQNNLQRRVRVQAARATQGQWPQARRPAGPSRIGAEAAAD